MLKSKVGYSNKTDAYEAGIETATMATEKLKPKIGLLFNSVGYNQEKLIAGIKSIIPEMDVIGCTSSQGILVPEGYIIDKTGAAEMLTFDDEDIDRFSDGSIESDNFSVEDAVGRVAEIQMGTQTRSYLYETFMSVLPLMNPEFSTMKEIYTDSDRFYEFENLLRSAAYQVGTKDENIPELESIYENDFIFRLNCTRPVGLKEQAIADELANAYSRDDNNRLKFNVRRFVKSASLLFSSIMLCVLVLADSLFKMMYSSKWDTAIPYFRLLCLSALILPLIQIVESVLWAKGESGKILYLSIMYKILIFVSI